jgi:hypothetical protein
VVIRRDFYQIIGLRAGQKIQLYGHEMPGHRILN